ncbi:MAG TPA: DUF6665 family protein [Xanthobacteraceae bacterium]|nr:DUF6665 family protein [Xanthobacteraceae bacterium]
MSSNVNRIRAPAPENPHAALEHEIAQEKAATLGRLGRRLEAALAALSEFDTARAGSTGNLTVEDRQIRHALVADAGVALWHFVVQREALGLRDSARVLRDYRVPDEVRDRMGVFPARG